MLLAVKAQSPNYWTTKEFSKLMGFLIYFFQFFHWQHQAACGIFSDQGWKPCPLPWKFRVLTTELPGKSNSWFWKDWFGSSKETEFQGGRWGAEPSARRLLKGVVKRARCPGWQGARGALWPPHHRWNAVSTICCGGTSNKSRHLYEPVSASTKWDNKVSTSKGDRINEIMS